jgi:hypothetical protein
MKKLILAMAGICIIAACGDVRDFVKIDEHEKYVAECLACHTRQWLSDSAVK